MCEMRHLVKYVMYNRRWHPLVFPQGGTGTVMDKYIGTYNLQAWNEDAQDLAGDVQSMCVRGHAL